MRIVYKQDNGIVAVVHPCPEGINPATGTTWTMEELAHRCVPSGYKYKIVEDSDIPADRSFRDAWVVDESDLTDGVSGS
tara:strand:- start:205 stop:441 length:237 start_codon:yes stop_codon:yes gene_type:complete